MREPHKRLNSDFVCCILRVALHLLPEHLLKLTLYNQ